MRKDRLRWIGLLNLIASLASTSGHVPPGFRQVQLPLAATYEARHELESKMRKNQRKLEMQYSFTSLRGGQLRRMPGPADYPACARLMTMAQQQFEINESVCRPELIQVMVRQYFPGKGLRLHADSEEYFQEPVLAVILRTGERYAALPQLS
eukprot:symbB.v1.2.016856.t1/scaffold1289.1/size126459/6